VPGKLTLLHSGVVYPSERDPTHLFAALRGLRESGLGSQLHLRLRGAGHEALLGRLIKAAGIDDMVEVVPLIPYRAALLEMLRADGLLLLQAANCNEQVPAKLYEYLRIRRPLVALTDPAGDTAGVLRSAGLDGVARLDREKEIRGELLGFIEACRAGTVRLPDPAFVSSASRLARTRQLASVLDQVDAGSLATLTPCRPN
jgi:hypothetical protein